MGLRILSPLTKVPLVESRSSMTTDSPERRSTAWRRDTSGSFNTRSASWRPMTTSTPSSTRRPASGPVLITTAGNPHPLGFPDDTATTIAWLVFDIGRVTADLDVARCQATESDFGGLVVHRSSTFGLTAESSRACRLIEAKRIEPRMPSTTSCNVSLATRFARPTTGYDLARFACASRSTIFGATPESLSRRALPFLRRLLLEPPPEPAARPVGGCSYRGLRPS